MDDKNKSSIIVFETSIIEMNRRKNAFRTLAVSIFASICIFSLDYLILKTEIAIPVMVLLLTLLIVSNHFFIKTFEKQKKNEIHLSDTSLERVFPKLTEKFMLQDIKDVRVKRTVKSLIREISFKTRNYGKVSINGLEDFEQFEHDLLEKLGKDNADKLRKERINFDHPIFYIILGVITGIVLTILLRLLGNVSAIKYAYIQIFVALYVIAIGIYWCIKRPLMRVYGGKFKKIDLIIGLLMIVIGIFIGSIGLLGGILK